MNIWSPSGGGLASLDSRLGVETGHPQMSAPSRTADPHLRNMLREARMAGLVKPNCSEGVTDERQEWAVSQLLPSAGPEFAKCAICALLTLVAGAAWRGVEPEP